MWALLFTLVAAADLDLGDRPVAKVIGLLKDMQSQLTAEKKEDGAMYEKMFCWCKNNGDGKDAAVELATKQVAQLESRIEALASKASGLETSLDKISAEAQADQEALDSASALRAKDRTEFEETEKDLIVSITGLKNALTVLAKPSFLQVPNGASFLAVKRTISRIVDKDDELMSQILGAPQRHSLTAFVQGQQGAGSTNEIIGVLKQMQENFEKNLAEARADESTSKQEFAELQSAKKAELAAAAQQTKEKTQLLAKTGAAHAEAKEDLEDTSGALSADQTFLVDLRKRCATADEEWAARSKTRATEIQAVSDTIKILNDDAAHDTFARSLGTFLQVDRFAWEPKGRALIQALTAAKADAKLDSFKEVTKSIDEMIAALKTEQKDEVSHKDFCKQELQKNEMTTMETTNELKDLVTRINDLSSAIETVQSDIEQLQAAIQDAHVEQMRASQNRVQENLDFQQVIADQRATQVVLKKAIKRMGDFYGLAQVGQSAQQEPGAAAPPPPPQMKEYKANAGAGGVMTMLENVLTDAHEMEAEATKAENDAQQAYEAFTHNSNGAVKQAQKAVTNKSEEKARAESDKTAAEADQADAQGRLEALNTALTNLHSSCDFVLDNFTARQQSRGAEIESLQGALAALRTA